MTEDDGDEELRSAAADLLAALAREGLTLGCCESLTGGLLAATITDVPGASRSFRGGLVTYASDLKCSLVGLEPEHVAEHGVITAHTARTMAQGARRVLGCDLAIACTGVAGPDPQDGAQVGTVWLSVAGPWGASDHLLQLDGDRQCIRRITVLEGIRRAREELLAGPRSGRSTAGSVRTDTGRSTLK
ncbi:CinA family protein [Luteococcus peritonei]|uniref:CinA family protein n=1 Tax=Luteococcus peritonei TaxID=88874 RepID=A0ABW4RT53_9ACTN